MDNFLKKTLNSLPMYFQTTPAECGLACIAMIACHYGKEINIGSLKKQFHLKLSGADLSSIVSISQKLEMEPRPVKASLSEIKDLQLPAILHFELSHYVVLKKVSRKGIDIHDPEKGEVSLLWSQVNNAFSGIAVELKPKITFQKNNVSNYFSMKNILENGIFFSNQFSIFFFISLSVAVMSIICIYNLGHLIDEIVNIHMKDSMHDIYTLILQPLFLFITPFLLLLIINHRSRHNKLNLLTRFSYNIFTHFFQQSIRLPLSYYENRLDNTHLKKAVTSLTIVKSYISDATYNLTFFCFIPIFIISMHQINFLFPIIATISIFISSTVTILGDKLVQGIDKNNYKDNRNFISLYSECYKLIRGIKVYQKENMYEGLFNNRVSNFLRYEAKKEIADTKVNAFLSIIYSTEIIIYIIIVPKLVFANSITIGELVIFILLRVSTACISTNSNRTIINYPKVKREVQNIEDIYLQSTENIIDTNSNTYKRDKLNNNDLIVRDISYKINDHSPYLFKNINLEVSQGEILSVVSAPGRGKSTLMKILAGLLIPTDGKIKYSGKDINIFGKQNYRSIIAYVMQTEYIFEGSILDNICLFEHNPDIERIKYCAKLALFDDEISDLPMQYNTMLFEGLLKLGQAQKLAIARALYSQPSILFLDEATARLEKKEEIDIFKNIKMLGISCISISHRNDAIYAADKIFHLDSNEYVDKYIKEKMSWR